MMADDSETSANFHRRDKRRDERSDRRRGDARRISAAPLSSAKCIA
jgi:hypothetical protein